MISSLIATLLPLSVSASIKVEGEGYLRFALDGRIVYAKSALLVTSEGRLKHESGASAMPLLVVPQGATDLQVAPDGTVTVTSSGEPKQIGRILLAVFAPGEVPQGQGAFLIARSRPMLVGAGESGAGSIVQAGQKPSRSSAKVATSTSGTKASMPGAPIVLKAFATLSTNRMTVDQFVEGDITETLRNHLRLADFGPAPHSGFSTKITRARILSKLASIGVDLGVVRFQIPEVVDVAAPSQTIEAKQFVEAAQNLCAEKFGSGLQLTLQGVVEPLRTATGAVEIRSESIVERGQQIQVNLGIFVDGNRVNGKTVVFAGQAPPVAVKAGDLVQVSMRASGIAVEVTGRAKKSGRVGDMIEVEVAAGDSSNKTVHIGRILRAGKVEVMI